MPLSEEQARFFDLFGYLSFPGLFATEAEAITEAFEAVWAEQGDGHDGRPHDHEENSSLLPFIDRHPYFTWQPHGTSLSHGHGNTSGSASASSTAQLPSVVTEMGYAAGFAST